MSAGIVESGRQFLAKSSDKVANRIIIGLIEHIAGLNERLSSSTADCMALRTMNREAEHALALVMTYALTKDEREAVLLYSHGEMSVAELEELLKQRGKQ